MRPRTRGPLTRVADLRALHVRGDPVLLPNVWDVESARTVAAAGFPAVATSSVAVAEALGLGDGEQVPVDLLFETLAAIASAVEVPVTADLERGYGLAPHELVARLAEAGVVGCNLEDSDPRTHVLVDPQQQADLLSAVRQAGLDQGWDLVLNARIDAAIHPGEADPLEECLRRAGFYTAADCVYPIFLAQAEELVRATPQPVNVLYRPGGPSLAEITSWGAARISWGAGLWRTEEALRGPMLQEIAASL